MGCQQEIADKIIDQGADSRELSYKKAEEKCMTQKISPIAFLSSQVHFYHMTIYFLLKKTAHQVILQLKTTRRDRV